MLLLTLLRKGEAGCVTVLDETISSSPNTTAVSYLWAWLLWLPWPEIPLRPLHLSAWEAPFFSKHSCVAAHSMTQLLTCPVRSARFPAAPYQHIHLTTLLHVLVCVTFFLIKLCQPKSPQS